MNKKLCKTIIFLILCLSILTLNSCNKEKTYLVTFDSNGGTEVAQQEVKNGESLTNQNIPVKIGYEFSGWYNGSTLYDLSQPIKKNISLTAKWTRKTLMVSYKTDDENIFYNQEIDYNGILNKPNSNPVKEGYTFVEWQLNGKKYDFNSYVTENLTLIASWSINEYVVSFDSDGGSIVSNQSANYNEQITKPENPTKKGYTFVEWRLNGKKYDFTQPITSNITLTAKWEMSEYQPKWTLNDKTNGWDGQGMTIKIVVDSKKMYDPFNEDYVNIDKKTKQAHMRCVEAAYNINIVYEDWGLKYPIERITKVKNSLYLDWEYDDKINLETGLAEGGVYIISIDSSWIYELARTGCLAPLYDISNQSGLFNIMKEYQQDEKINTLTQYQSKIYGYTPYSVKPDYFMYYNADIISELGLEDPAELWFKGEWTWNKFETYIDELQKRLEVGQTALAINYTNFFIGLSASLGKPLITNKTELNLCQETTYDVLNKIKLLYNSDYYDKTIDSEVPESFFRKDAVFVSGELFYLNNNNYFDRVKRDFTIGIVPYPTSNDNGGESIVTTKYESEAIIYGYDGEPLEDKNGNYITGLDLSNSTFKLPYISTECYAIPRFYNQKNNINYDIVFSILYDLISGYEENYENTEEERYKDKLLQKLTNELYVNVVLSVEETIYFDPIVGVSMRVNELKYPSNSLWNIIPKIIKNNDVVAKDILEEIENDYLEELKELGL